MDARDLISWNAIIAGYASNGEWLKALLLFGNLVSVEKLLPDSVTMVSILPACAELKNLEAGKQIHACICRHPFLFEDVAVGNALKRLNAENDCPEQALGLFYKLQAQGMKPGAVTIMSLLPICTQMAPVHLLRQCHGYIIRSCFEDLHLKGALLDAYAKCGIIGSAHKIFQSSADKDLVMLCMA
ncbi:hypothetical protein RJT34_27932 [Clitoria ternatea]|uniref:Pentatricopeptide repeat-containing protein n=1 Tax=Clitoria ternatea TaxID=43366 RepID=A0AAN9I8R8_CLITE